eukprot:scaffold39783_cov283-Amphora_coffeaeformis.AAC.1
MKVKQLLDTRRIIVRSSSNKSVDSHASSVPVEAPRKGQRQKKIVRKIRFSEEHNVYHEDLLDIDDRKDLWYTNSETVSFKARTTTLVKRVLNHERYIRDSWVNSLQRAYQGFCTAGNVDDVEYIMSQTQTFMRAATTGLEKWAVNNMVHDRVRRRKQTWKTVLYLQGTNASVDDIRLACRQLSRPSCLFAHHIALMSAL